VKAAAEAVGRRNRPARRIADVCGRPQIVGEAEAAATFAERLDLSRIFRAADPGPLEIGLIRTNSALLSPRGLQARDFGLARHGSRSAVKNPRRQPPARRGRGADEIQTNSARHPRRFDEFI